MTPEEAHAVRYALLHETNPTHLTGFASVLAPEHAVAASLLFARAQVLERRRTLGTPLMTALLDRINAVASAPPQGSLEPGLAELAAQLRSRPGLAHAVLAAAGDMVAQPMTTSLADLPPEAQGLVHRLLADVAPGVTPPILVLKPIATSLLGSDPASTTPDKRAQRALWVGQYVREAAIRGVLQ